MLFKNIRIIFAVYIVLSLFIYTFRIPPFEKPDEDLHFLRTVSVSRGNLLCKVDSNRRSVNLIPSAILDYVNGNDAPASGKGNYVNEIHSCVLPFFYYLAPAAPVSTLMNLDFPMDIVFYAGRSVNVIMALLILFVSLKNLPIAYQLVSLYVFSWPMVLYQVSSYSKDSYFIVLGLYIFNRFMKAVISKTVGRAELVGFIAATIFFILARPQYAWFVCLLPITLHLHAPKKTKILNYAVITATVLTILFSLFALISQKVYLTPDNTNYALSFYAEINPGLQLEHVITHPLSFATTLVSTTVGFFNFYIKSSIGIFGALDQPLPNYIYFFYIVVGALLVKVLSHEKHIDLFAKWRYALLLITSSTMFLLFFAMYLYGSPVGSPLIFGVQGRYFVNLVPLMIILVAQLIQVIRKESDCSS